MVYVTHDQVEAMTLADKIVVLRGGRVEQVGAPLDLYRDPDNLFVAGFIGSPAMNLLPATPVRGRVDGPALGEIAAAVPGHAPAKACGRSAPAGHCHNRGHTHTVEMTEALGGVSYIHCAAPDQPKLVIEARGTHVERPGAKVGLRADPAALYMFDADSGLRVR